MLSTTGGWKRLRILAAMGLLLFNMSKICATAGPYPPAAGQPGSSAIHMDDPSFRGWATGIEVVRGSQDISDPYAPDAGFGSGELALGKASGDALDAISLGDNGAATLTFDSPIVNGPGYDFAVFENGFSDDFLELAFVEVSTNGVDFFRFDSVSLTPVDKQVAGFGTLDPTDLDNLAGKYRQGYGTPFDVEELAGTPGLDINRIWYVRIVDVVGSIDELYASYDSLDNKINDPWPTPFESCGFDLEAVGVIHTFTCQGDFDFDQDVDGEDLMELGKELQSIDLSDFSANFGDSHCMK